MGYAADFEKALQVGRPPTICGLFPNSKALIVSGKVIDRAMLAKGKAVTMAVNGRNYFVIRGALAAAQHAVAHGLVQSGRHPVGLGQARRQCEFHARAPGLELHAERIALCGLRYGLPGADCAVHVWRASRSDKADLTL